MTETRKATATGWKCFDQDLRCRDLQFEVGKTYEVAGELEMCKHGFHFHEVGSYLFEYYSNDTETTRVCEVVAHDVLTGNDKSVCRKLEVVRELGFVEICQTRGGNGYGNGNGYGYGYGYGDGYGNGYGNGYGYGYGYGYKRYIPVPYFITFRGREAA